MFWTEHSPPFQGGVAAAKREPDRRSINKRQPGWLLTSTNKVRFAVRFITTPSARLMMLRSI